MRILETVLKPREFDGKIEKLCRVKDHEKSYAYKTDTGYEATYVPDKWICTGVYDLEMIIDV
jgi:hypothetical protein